MAGKPFNAFEAGAAAGPYDERPTLLADIDPQLHVSRNDKAQPFHLICEKDCVLVQMSGEANVEFTEGNVRYFAMEPGDFVYVPAGMPHRIVPLTTSIQYRFKAREAGLEGVAWFCPDCGSDLLRQEWDTAVTLPQDGYIEACKIFNQSKRDRTCASCGEVHPEIDLSPYRWETIATEIKEDRAKNA